MIKAIIIAAGESRRMRTESEKPVLKPVLPFRGRTVLGYQIETIKSCAVSEIIVVLGCQASLIQETLINYPVTVTLNQNYESGMLSSIQQGIREVIRQGREQLTGMMICLGDQPGIGKETIDYLIEYHETHPDSILIPTYQSHKGHPIIIPVIFLDEIMKLPLDKGLRELMSRHENRIQLLPLTDPWITQDIDTPEDYQKVILN